MPTSLDIAAEDISKTCVKNDFEVFCLYLDGLIFWDFFITWQEYLDRDTNICYKEKETI